MAEENTTNGKTASAMGDKRDIHIHWFRHGLRIHDNPALLDAMKGSYEFYPVFIFDKDVAGIEHAGYNRMRFLWDSVRDLDESFKKHGGRLFVLHGPPHTVLANLIQEWGVTRITFEQDPEPIWQDRDDKVKDMCDSMGVEWVEKISHTLYDPAEIIKLNGGTPPSTYKLFQHVCTILGDPDEPAKYPDFTRVSIPIPDNYDDRFALKTLDDMKILPEFPEQVAPLNKWIGGETRGLELLDCRIKSEEAAYKAGYVMPNQYRPDLLGPPLSLSPYLRFGNVSARTLYHKLCETYKKVRIGEETNIHLYGQLIWREFFYVMSVGNINYDKMEGNPICLQIDWYDDEETYKKWEMGQTGFPWIDACMNQLRHEGWIHHVGRHAVSCFLTRGDLWIHWEKGLQMFLKYQIDGDWSVCAGNWMWVSSSAFEDCLQCPQCLSPVMYGGRMDPTGEYVRRYVPALKNMPLKYLFNPWKAPKKVQQKAGCVIGVDYPNPIVDHTKANSDCKEKMQGVKERLKDKLMAVCSPSDADEARVFSWLPSSATLGTTCTGDMLCEFMENL